MTPSTARRAAVSGLLGTAMLLAACSPAIPNPGPTPGTTPASVPAPSSTAAPSASPSPSPSPPPSPPPTPGSAAAASSGCTPDQLRATADTS